MRLMILSSWMCADGIVGCVIVDVEAVPHLLPNLHPFPVQTTRLLDARITRDIGSGIGRRIVGDPRDRSIARLGIAIHNDNTGSLFSSCTPAFCTTLLICGCTKMKTPAWQCFPTLRTCISVACAWRVAEATRLYDQQ
ncbi:hypothetical protein C8R43DRAFT_698944 [Mycena crocata]|nr:hypothetical protein C8R43DRAFT_698944 [Mycena crocata]